MFIWLAALSYWVHLLSTVVWLGGLAALVFVALPAWRQQSVSDNEWLALQKRLAPFVNVSLVLLLVTGFFQMTNDAQYKGFLVLDGVWAWAMLFKHIAYVGMVGITFFLQFGLHPEMDRVALLMAEPPDAAVAERRALQKREGRLLSVNLGCGVFILLCTAVMTAVS